MTLPIHIHLVIIYFFYKESVSVDSCPVNIYLFTEHTFWHPFKISEYITARQKPFLN
jgi:hypothetical protein